MISENILRLQQRISLACQRAARDEKEIKIIAVTKTASVQDIKQAIESGIIDIGENKVQDALIKHNQLQMVRQAHHPEQNRGATNYKLQSIKWHMVGHLQTNKVKEALKVFDLIHSLDSLKLAAEIDRQAGRINKLAQVLVQVNTSVEKSKFGLSPGETVGFIKDISDLKNIRVMGLMAIAPLVDNPEEARPFFRRLRELLEDINARHITQSSLLTLSMGMTDDFEVAIEEGANLLRIGRAIFGRGLTQINKQ